MNRMNVCRWLLGGCLFFLSAFSLSAQNARDLLDRASQAFSKAGGVQVEFTMQMGGEEQLVKGSIALQGERFVLDAAGVKTWFDGHTQWSYVKANEEVNVSQPTSEELHTLNPYAWLSLYKKGYQLQLLKTTDKAYEVAMESVDALQTYHRIAIELDKRTCYPLSVCIQPTVNARDNVLIRITGFKPNQQFADGYFSFQPARYPQVEVIDLR